MEGVRPEATCAQNPVFMRVSRTLSLLTMQLLQGKVNGKHLFSTGFLWVFPIFTCFWPNFPGFIRIKCEKPSILGLAERSLMQTEEYPLFGPGSCRDGCIEGINDGRGEFEMANDHRGQVALKRDFRSQGCA